MSLCLLTGKVFHRALMVGSLLTPTVADAYSEIDLPPTPFADFTQATFSEYLSETRSWIKENREFRSDNIELEVEVNSPFELKPDAPNGKAILLIHGLSDSPYSFADVAKRLVSKGFLVRTVLLPGHGGKPSDLMLPSIDDWLGLVRHHTELLSQDADEVWLGGFSTGANLALIEAIDNPAVSGTLLLSPAIVSRKPLDFLAPLAKYVLDWADVDPEVNITRFDSLSMNGAALYYETSRRVRKMLKDKGFDRPVLVTLSESDSVVDSEAVYRYVTEYFSHENKQVLWFGEQKVEGSTMNLYSMKLPTKRISTGSHMSVLYSPSNVLYGEQGVIRICDNGQSEASEKACEKGVETWFSSFDYTEVSKIHARLTWNPYFEETMSQVLELMNSTGKQ